MQAEAALGRIGLWFALMILATLAAMGAKDTGFGVHAAMIAVLAGAAASIAGVAAFRRARTTVNPLKPDSASSLVDSGIYRLTRNPMYLGFALALLGWGIFLSNPLSLAMLFVFVGYMNRFQIVPEERALESLFGDAFKAYRSKVRRWL